MLAIEPSLHTPVTCIVITLSLHTFSLTDSPNIIIFYCVSSPKSMKLHMKQR